MDFSQILDEIGIHDDVSYQEYIKRIKENGVTANDVELLNPDKIDNAAFWKFIDEKFSYSICGDMNLLRSKNNDYANYINYVLAITTGVDNYLRSNAIIVEHPDYNESKDVLEIGVGFGNLKNFVTRHTSLRYHGIDIVGRVPGVIETDGRGIPASLKSKKFINIFSSNVFQHLSISQRRQYYKDVAECLVPGGLFSFGLQALNPNYAKLDYNKVKGAYCKETGKFYICHYGQFTEQQTPLEIFADLEQVGLSPVSWSYRHDCYITLHYRKMEDITGVNNATDSLCKDSPAKL